MTRKRAGSRDIQNNWAGQRQGATVERMQLPTEFRHEAKYQGRGSVFSASLDAPGKQHRTISSSGQRTHGLDHWRAGSVRADARLVIRAVIASQRHRGVNIPSTSTTFGVPGIGT